MSDQREAPSRGEREKRVLEAHGFLYGLYADKKHSEVNKGCALVINELLLELDRREQEHQEELRAAEKDWRLASAMEERYYDVIQQAAADLGCEDETDHGEPEHLLELTGEHKGCTSRHAACLTCGGDGKTLAGKTCADCVNQKSTYAEEIRKAKEDGYKLAQDVLWLAYNMDVGRSSRSNSMIITKCPRCEEPILYSYESGEEPCGKGVFDRQKCNGCGTYNFIERVSFDGETINEEDMRREHPELRPLPPTTHQNP